MQMAFSMVTVAARLSRFFPANESAFFYTTACNLDCYASVYAGHGNDRIVIDDG